MDKAPDYGSGDSRFESWQDRENLTIFFSASNATNSPGKIALIRLIKQKKHFGENYRRNFYLHPFAGNYVCWSGACIPSRTFVIYDTSGTGGGREAESNRVD